MSETAEAPSPSSTTCCPKPLSIQDLVSISSHIELRVGRMVSVEKHPSADKLYIEQVDFGTEMGTRTVISGLVPYFSPDQIQGRLCVFVTNLKPASMRGVKSQAMVLVAHGPCGNVEFIVPPKNAQSGDRATFCMLDECGGDGKALGASPADPVLNPKKRYWETVQPILGVDPSSKSIILKAPDGSKAVLQCGSDLVCTSTLVVGTIF